MFLLRVAENHTFLFFTFIKFLVGMRLILTIYILLKKRIPFAQYLFMNILGTFLFVGALFPMGWFLGKGISSAFSFEKGITSLISVIIVAMFLVSVLPRVANFLIGRYMKKHKGSIQGETPV
jgi:membrane protein DedA with SNARE-associated domain